MAAEEVGFRFSVSGKVQGVFFRASTAREAARLGLRGHAINLPDGRVQVLAVGSAAAVEELRHWLQRGPPAARVECVDAAVEPEAVRSTAPGFRTG
jgi:acylphosphatase